MDKEKVKKEVAKLIEDELSKYNILLHHIADDDKETIAKLIADSFYLGFEYMSKQTLYLNDRELLHAAYALDCRYGLGDDLAEKIYNYMEKKTGENYRL